MLTYGIDEAGRGPILGPMVLACVGLSDEAAELLLAAGVRDSKAFGSGARGQARRRELAALIRLTAASVASRVVSPAEIDQRVRLGELNHLEREVAVDLLAEVYAPVEARIVCDGASLFRPLSARFPNLVAVDHGEEAEVAVAAASIIAKSLRDEAFEAIAQSFREEFGPLAGGGYLNAPTRRFLDAFTARYGRPPDCTRLSWGEKRAA